MNNYVTKGSRIVWQVFSIPCLAGGQMKGQVSVYSGIVRHVRADHPTEPKEIRFYVDPDQAGLKLTPLGCLCGHDHVEVKPDEVIRILADTNHRKS